MKSHLLKGYLAELFAAMLLTIKGYIILKRRYKNHFGEIDIIAKKKNLIVFVEVKARKDSQSLSDAISPVQQQRIQNAALSYLNSSDQPIRFDAILFCSLFKFKHIKNAW